MHFVLGQALFLAMFGAVFGLGFDLGYKPSHFARVLFAIFIGAVVVGLDVSTHNYGHIINTAMAGVGCYLASMLSTVFELRERPDAATQ